MLRMMADDDIAQERLSQVADHMAGTGSSTGSSNKKGRSSLLEKNPDDVSTVQVCLMTRLRLALLSAHPATVYN